jgi:cell division protein FtsB
MDFRKELESRLKSITIGSFLNKYALTVIVFVIWVSFFDRYNLINQVKLSNSVSTLQEAKADYEKQLEEALKEREIINQDIEKYAREKYLFHKDNEKVILIK